MVDMVTLVVLSRAPSSKMAHISTVPAFSDTLYSVSSNPTVIPVTVEFSYIVLLKLELYNIFSPE